MPSKISRKRGVTLHQKQNLAGWLFLLPATFLIFAFSFYPMIRAFMRSLQTGVEPNNRFAGLYNYKHLLNDPIFRQAMGNTFIYLIVQVPIMLITALVLASMLNQRNIKGRGIFRTSIFLPSATALVSYAIIFRSMFAVDGLINQFFQLIGVMDRGVNWLSSPHLAKVVIIVALIWRWTGYNMIFYLSGLQALEPSIYEAARIDGANLRQQFFNITVPLLRPIILLTAIMSTSGTLQLFDESMNLTAGGPGNHTITMSHYIFKVSFEFSPNFGYATAMSFVILVFVAILSAIQMKLGDKR